MRRLAPCLLVLPLCAGEVDPATYLPADPALSVVVPDLARSRERWQTTPYARLAQTPWGRLSVSRLTQLAGWWGPDLPQALDAARALALGLGVTANGQPDAVLAVRGDGVAMERACALIPAGTVTTTRSGDVLALAYGGIAPAQRQAVPAAIDPEADAQVHYGPARLPAVLAAFATPVPEMPGVEQQPAMTATIRLDPIGLRERWQGELDARVRPMAPELRRHTLDRAVFATLPRTAVWAIAGRAVAAVNRPVFAAVGLDAANPAIKPIEDLLAAQGLPGYLDSIQALDGPIVAWMEEGVPFPTVTCALGMDAAVAKRWVDGAADKLHLARQADGSASGFVGLINLAIGVDAPAQGPAMLVLSSAPQGLDSWRKRPGGFTEHAEIVTALAEIPADALCAGVSRGGAAWSALAQLAVLPLSQLVPPQIMSLPQDLRQQAKHGFFHLTLTDSAVRLEAGGLFGGPLGWGLATGAIAGGIGAHHAVWTEERRLRQQAKPPAKPPVDAPVF
jgi:hypothetical protein